MDPEKMRQCMSLGYSAKSKLANTIGQCNLFSANPLIICFLRKRCLIYLLLLDGNGFKTSTMRLGADVIVFSRCPGKNGKRLVLYYQFVTPFGYYVFNRFGLYFHF